MTKREIATTIKNIDMKNVTLEWNKLKQLSVDDLNKLNGRSRLGCDFIDYYFFEARIDTIGNKGINFFTFLENIEEYKSKKYIQTLLTFCEKNNRYTDNLIKKYYYCYGLCFGRINAFKITNALSIYHKYKPTSILDPFCGFGGRLTAAMLLNIDYCGIDLNRDLKPAYDKLLSDFLDKEQSQKKFELRFEDALHIDYSKLNKKYDMVFTSPPYENIEIYKYMEKKSIEEWIIFYNTIFQKLWTHLEIGGHFIININDKIYNRILIPLFGLAHESILLKKSSKNEYEECIYIWKNNK